ncbi:MAG: hypothetical protein ACSLFC_13270 [Desulfuromonadales bacterium]
MKIISFIDERLLIRRILEHLGLWQERIPKGLPPPVERIPVTIVCEEFDDGWGRSNDQDGTLH